MLAFVALIQLIIIFSFSSLILDSKTICMYIYSNFQQFWQPGLTGPSTSQDIKPFGSACYGPGKTGSAIVSGDSNLQATHTWEGRSIATHKFRLVEFSAYLELRAEEAVSFKSFVFNSVLH